MTIRRFSGGGFESAPVRGQRPVFGFDGNSWTDQYLNDGLVAYYPMEPLDFTDELVKDRSGNEIDLMYGGVVTDDDGRVGGSGNFDRDENASAIEYAPDILTSITDEVTISTWVYFTSNFSFTYTFTLSVDDGRDGIQYGQIIRPDSGGGDWGMRLSNHSDVTAVGVESRDWELETWYHVVTTLEVVDNESVVTGYVNGDEVGSSTSSVIPESDVGKFVTLGSRNDDSDGFDTTGHMDGLLDEIRVYDRVITKDEIESLYHHGVSLNPNHAEPDDESGPPSNKDRYED